MKNIKFIKLRLVDIYHARNMALAEIDADCIEGLLDRIDEMEDNLRYLRREINKQIEED